MKFLSLIVGAILAATATAYNACEDGDRPFAPMQAVGDKHDASKYDVDICETQWHSGSVVQAIEVWGSKSRISGIQLTYSNGDKSHMIGAREGDLHQNLKWDSKTLVTRVVLWSDWDARQLGGLRVELSNGDKLEMKQDRISSNTFSPNVGSGILLGAYGRADDHITAWGWLFLESSVEKISIGDFKWDQTQEQFMKSQSGIQRTMIDTQTEYNIASQPITMHMDKTSSEQSSYSYSQSVSQTYGFGYSLEISGQVAGVGPKASFSVSATFGFDTKKEWSKSENAGLAVKTIHECLPGKTTVCVGFAEFSKFDMGYEAKVTLKLKSGKTFSFRERGTKKQTLYAKSQVACADEDGDHRKEDPYEFVERRIKETKKEEEEKKKQAAAAPSNNSTSTTPKRLVSRVYIA